MSSAPEQESLAALAARHGLRRSVARPDMRVYLRRLWERRHFVLVYATSRTVSKYSTSALGQLWQVLTPLLNAGIYWVMFGLVLGGHEHIANYPAFLVTGMFVFTYSQRSASAGAKSVSGNLSLIRALHFPRAALPLAYTLQELRQSAVSMGVLLILVVVMGEFPTWYWLLIPVVLLLQTMFNTGLSLALARLGASLRDVNQLLPFVLRTWLYASGVFFSIQYKIVGYPDPATGKPVGGVGLPQWVADVMYLNPAASVIEVMRGILIHTYSPRPIVWLSCVFWAVAGLLLGLWYFWRAEDTYGRG
ncbi:ABC transporter permease [Nonomuraea sp. NPDC049607]|uniref:ABC transporter permease n=1 Tax=Nonomuraea sp. NPDC049607 TaxID=3154732 RepID=UPI0034373695